MTGRYCLIGPRGTAGYGPLQRIPASRVTAIARALVAVRECATPILASDGAPTGLRWVLDYRVEPPRLELAATLEAGAALAPRGRPWLRSRR